MIHNHNYKFEEKRVCIVKKHHLFKTINHFQSNNYNLRPTLQQM